MELLLITQPHFFEGETGICNEQFKKGLKRLHLRKPEASMQQLSKWIEEIEPAYRKRIVLHNHHDLALQYGLGGIHISPLRLPFWGSDCSGVEALLKRGSGERAVRTFSLSRSCHSIEEVEKCQNNFDYVFLSPIFDSISKQGYKAAFSKEELADAKARGILSKNVYALGGVTFDKLQDVERLGFHGAALLGGFWGNRKIILNY